MSEGDVLICDNGGRLVGIDHASHKPTDLKRLVLNQRPAKIEKPERHKSSDFNDAGNIHRAVFAVVVLAPVCYADGVARGASDGGVM